jgi:hypothetical protein
MKSNTNDLKRLINDQDFQRLELMLKIPNIFNILRILNKEIRHSNFLSWLFDPNEKHGLDTAFLHKFILDILNSSNDTNLDIFDCDALKFNDVNVQREWNNIDILITIKESIGLFNEIVVCIENKIDSSDSKDQLKKYRDFLETNHKGKKTKLLFVYLTPFGDEPNDNKEKNFWLTYSYAKIENILKDLLELYSERIGVKELIYIRDYNEIIRREIMQNGQVNKQALKLYYNHKNTIDFIIKNIPDAQRELCTLLERMIKNEGNLLLDDSLKTYIRFTTKEIDKIIPKCSTGWTSSNRILLFEFRNRIDNLCLYFIIGPGDNEYRKQMKENFEAKKLFNLAHYKMRSTYFSVYKKIFLSKKDIKEKTIDELKVIVRNNFDDFIRDDLQNIEKYIIETQVKFKE